MKILKFSTVILTGAVICSQVLAEDKGQETKQMPAIVQSPDGALNVRDSPDSKSKILATLKNDDLIVIQAAKESEGWVFVNTREVEGYVKAKYVTALSLLSDSKKSELLKKLEEKKSSNGTKIESFLGTWRYQDKGSEFADLLVLKSTGSEQTFIYQMGTRGTLMPETSEMVLTRKGEWIIDDTGLLLKGDGGAFISFDITSADEIVQRDTPANPGGVVFKKLAE